MVMVPIRRGTGRGHVQFEDVALLEAVNIPKLPFPNPAMVPGIARTDDEGNDKTYEHEAVTAYWLEHYTSTPTCDLCDNRGVIRTLHGVGTVERHYFICPNGQAMRWHKARI